MGTQTQTLNPDCALHCSVYNNAKLQTFAASFFLAGMVSSLFAAKVSRAFGRRITMIIGGCGEGMGGASAGGQAGGRAGRAGGDDLRGACGGWGSEECLGESSTLDDWAPAPRGQARVWAARWVSGPCMARTPTHVGWWAAAQLACGWLAGHAACCRERRPLFTSRRRTAERLCAGRHCGSCQNVACPTLRGMLRYWGRRHLLLPSPLWLLNSPWHAAQILTTTN